MVDQKHANLPPLSPKKQLKQKYRKEKDNMQTLWEKELGYVGVAYKQAL